jgi:3',5'-cyclic AMP phosphodiesterase CpdA
MGKTRIGNAVKIHHLTDIHVGPLHHTVSHKIPFVPSDAKGYQHLEYYLAYLRARSPSDLPDLVIISGDLTSYAAEDEFHRAKEHIKQINEVLKRRPRDFKRIYLVPGNHDLDWSREKYEEKSRRFVTFCEALAAIAWTSETTIYVDLPVLNIGIALLDSCSLGGTHHPEISALQATFETLKHGIPNDQTRSTYEDALERLQALSRQDPGYVAPDRLRELEQKLSTVQDQAQRCKIAVIHHNPSNLPSADLETYDTLVLGGQLKQKLMTMGFDILLHGHRHFQHCCYEEYLDQNGTTSVQQAASHYKEGLYIVSGGTMGSDQRGAWFEIRMDDTDNAHLAAPPSSLVSIYEAWADQGETTYRLARTPKYKFSVDKSTHSHLKILQERLGRNFTYEEVRLAEEALGAIWHPLQKLYALIFWGDWAGDSDWDRNFSESLSGFSFVYATDMLPAASLLNTRYLLYMASQFRERLKRNQHTTQGRLSFSEHALSAIRRTGWSPLSGFAEGYPMNRESGSSELEIIRILHLDSEDESEKDIVRVIDFYHRLFGVPVFVLPRSALPPAQRGEEFVLGLGSDLYIKEHSFYKSGTRTAIQVDKKRREELLKRFEAFLQDDRLRTLESVYAS